jgi:hypothetical protein
MSAWGIKGVFDNGFSKFSSAFDSAIPMAIKGSPEAAI